MMQVANRLKDRGNRAYQDGHFDTADACYSEGVRVLEALPSDDGVDSTCIMLMNRWGRLQFMPSSNAG